MPISRTKDPARACAVRFAAWRCLVGGVAAYGELGTRLASAFISNNSASIDAWIEPPVYTGLPLTQVAAGDLQCLHPGRFGAESARPWRAACARLSAGGNRARPSAAAKATMPLPATIAHDGRVRVRVAGHVLGRLAGQRHRRQGAADRFCRDTEAHRA